MVAWFQRHQPDSVLTLTIEDGSPWTLVEFRRPLAQRWLKYAIWNETGALHRMDQEGMVLDPPIDPEELP